MRESASLPRFRDRAQSKPQQVRGASRVHDFAYGMSARAARERFRAICDFGGNLAKHEDASMGGCRHSESGRLGDRHTSPTVQAPLWGGGGGGILCNTQRPLPFPGNVQSCPHLKQKEQHPFHSPMNPQPLKLEHQ